LASAAGRVRKVSQMEQRQNAEVWAFCFTSIDVTRAKLKIVQLKKNSLEVLQISCHICNKVCQAQEIEKIPEREHKTDLKTSDLE
jgi:hypothetical protein